MATLHPRQAQWSISLYRKQLKTIAKSIVPSRVDPQVPPIPKDFHPTVHPFTRGAQPALLAHRAEFEQTIRHLMKHELKFGMKGKIFGELLCRGLNHLNEQVGLPPLTNCNLINGYARNEFGLYTRAVYSTKTGGIGLHYELDAATFPSTIAHELTHLEQDYLFICLLADFLGIGESASAEQVSDLGKLIVLNQGIEPTSQKLSLFLNHRNGRLLQGAQKLRATQILHDFRFAPYLTLIAKDHQQTRKLVSARSLVDWLYFDYEAFLSSLLKDKDSVPEALSAILLQVDRCWSEFPSRRKIAGKNIFQLIRYYSSFTGELSQYLLELYRTRLYFEREAYAVGREFS